MSWVVECNTVQASPGAGASARATPPPPATAIAERAAIVASRTHRSLLMVEFS